jgi:SHS2 domain-containing protein
LPYRYLEHTADAGIEANGATLEETLAAAAEGLAAWLCDASTVRPVESRVFEVHAADLVSVVVDWLNEVNFEFEVGRFAFSRFEVAPLEGATLKAIGYGEPLDPARHHPGEQVKSVTYHGVKVEQAGGGWTVRVYLDI